MPEFVPLHVALRLHDESRVVETQVLPVPEIPAAPHEAAEERSALLSEIRRFRAGVADAFEYEVETLLRDVAADVLARELQLAPADVAAIVARTRSRCARERIVAVHVHPEDVGALANLDIDVLSDAALRRGDVVIELQSGTVDLSLGVRLDAVLAREGARA
jgi:flagellar biosynthesis/type III secretory pathway protein FliH